MVPMNMTRVMLTAAALGLALVPTTNAANIDDLLELLGKANESGASTSCGQYSASGHGWGPSPSASADMTVVTDSGSYGSGDHAYAWANGFGGGSASATGGPWASYCNTVLLGLLDVGSSESTTLVCNAGPGPEQAFAGDVLQAADGALFLSDGLVAYAMAGTLDLGQAVAVPLPAGLADTGVDVVYSNGAAGCSVAAV